MKFNVLLIVLLCLASVAGAAPAAYINGRSYTPLVEWARNNGFKGMASYHKGELDFTNHGMSLVFTVDSKTALFNGIEVALSFPVANVKDTAFISYLDLDTAIRPLLYPPSTVAGKKALTICLDPGHGGRDSGNRVTWHYEKKYTLALASELKDLLKKMGYRVILTRTKDSYVDLPVRPDIANRNKADLFISLHFNATETGRDQVKGPETYCITPVGASSTNARGEGSNYGATPANRTEAKSLLLAYEVQRSLVKNLDCPDRSVRRARFAVLRDATMPAILIEGGYMTNPSEGKKIFDDSYRHQLAQAIVYGIQAYQRMTDRPLMGKDTAAAN